MPKQKSAPVTKPVTITQTFTPEFVRSVINGFMENYPEASMSIRCTGWDYDKLKFTFEDTEDGKRYKIAEKHLVKAFKLMFTGKWPNGLRRPPVCTDEKAWDSFWNHVDAEYTDAFGQLAIFGEVIYG